MALSSCGDIHVERARLERWHYHVSLIDRVLLDNSMLSLANIEMYARKACKVTINNSFRYAIVDGSAVLANLYNPEAENASSFLRTQLWLATVIIHELGHVFGYPAPLNMSYSPKNAC
jgi:predicted Zn-dependent protease